jgi:hypothetical protein
MRIRHCYGQRRSMRKVKGWRLGLGVFRVEDMMNQVGFRPIKFSRSGLVSD